MCSLEKKEKKKPKKEIGVARGLVLLKLHLHFFFFSFFFFFPEFFFAVSAFWVINNNYFWFEIESLRLDFHVDATWKKCPIRREQSIKIESQKLDLWTLNRVS